MEQPTSGPIAQLHGAWGQGTRATRLRFLLSAVLSGSDFALVRWDLCLILLLWSCVKMVCCLLDPFLESLFPLAILCAPGASLTIFFRVTRGYELLAHSAL